MDNNKFKRFSDEELARLSGGKDQITHKTKNGPLGTTAYEVFDSKNGELQGVQMTMPKDAALISDGDYGRAQKAGVLKANRTKDINKALDTRD